MKNHHIAFWIAVFGVVLFLSQVHRISGLDDEATIWRAQADDLANPGMGSYVKALFDGATLGAFSGGDIFSEADKAEQKSDQLDAERTSILSRYGDAIWYRNWGFVIGIGAVVTGLVLKTKESKAGVKVAKA